MPNSIINNSKWHSRFLRIACEISSWSKDTTQVGAVAIGQYKQVLSQGFNGFPRSISDNLERFQSKEEKYKYTIHAEANLIYNALLSGVSLIGAHVYIYGVPPCFECAKALIQCQISMVVVDSDAVGNCQEPWQSRWVESIKLFEEANVLVKIVRIIEYGE